jgi:hypothetical protein
VPPSLRVAVSSNQRLVSPGANILMLNGMLLEVNNFELYGKGPYFARQLQFVRPLSACPVVAFHAAAGLQRWGLKADLAQVCNQQHVHTPKPKSHPQPSLTACASSCAWWGRCSWRA